eukprot:3270035-Pyramimonas_sp.AAC.1
MEHQRNSSSRVQRGDDEGKGKKRSTGQRTTKGQSHQLTKGQTPEIVLKAIWSITTQAASTVSILET